MTIKRLKNHETSQKKNGFQFNALSLYTIKAWEL